jgi:hypothetical protein
MAIIYRNNPMPLGGAIFVTNPRSRRKNTWSGDEVRHKKAAESSDYYKYLKGTKTKKRASSQKRRKGKKVGWSPTLLRKARTYTASPTSKTYGNASRSEVTGAMRDLEGLIKAKVITKTQANKLIRHSARGREYMEHHMVGGRVKQGKKNKLATDVSRLLRAADGRKSRGKHRKDKAKAKLNSLLGSSETIRYASLAEEFGISNPRRSTTVRRRRRNTRKTRINKLRLRLRRNALRVNRRRKAKKAKKTTAWTRFMKRNTGKGWAVRRMGREVRKLNNPRRKKRTKRKGTRKGMVRKTARRAYFPKPRRRRRTAIRVNRRRITRRRRSNGGGYGGLTLQAGGRQSSVVGKGLNLVGDLQKSVKKIPILRYGAWLIAPIVLGATIAYVQRAIEPRLIPALAESGIPGAKTIARAPYLTTGALVGASLIGLSTTKFGKKFISTPTAAKVAGLAVATGVFADMFLPGLVKAAADVAREEAAAMTAQALQAQAAQSAPAEPAAYRKGYQGYGDGGFYMIGANTRDLGAVAYSDANYADAHFASNHMTPNEVSAALQGPQVYIHVFPGSPIKLKQQRRIQSRHAGLPGHRYGWLIKMIGFDAFQKIVAMPPHQRHIAIARLRKQAMASVPGQIAAAKKAHAMAESASMPVAGAANGHQTSTAPGYGALMFAGQNY